MAVDMETLVVQLTADIKNYERQLARARRQTDKEMKGIEGRLAKVGLSFAKGFAGAFASTAAITAAQRLIDASTRINNSLKVAGLSGGGLTQVYDRLYESAQRNAAPFETLVELYSRVSTVQKELGVSSDELVRFSDNVALALRVAGTDAQSASGALLQLSQALGAGTVRAEEFSSILEGAPTIAQAAAAGLKEAGGSVAELRKLVVDGKVSSEAFFRAFEAGAVTLQEKVSGSSLTVADSFRRITNALIRTAGEFDEATGVSNRTATALGNVAEAIEDIGDVMVRVSNGPVGQFIGKLGELDAKARAVFGFLANFTLNDELLGILAPTPSEGPDFVRTARGKRDRAFADPIQSRIDQAFDASSGQVRTVSLADLAPPASADTAKKAKDTFKETRDGFADLIGYTESYREQQEKVNQSVQDFGDLAIGAANSLATALSDGKLEGEELVSILQQVVTELVRMAQAAGGVQNLIGNLFGGGFNPTPGGFAQMLGFAGGGYTGAGGKYEPAGIVHRGEYVFDKSAVDRIGVGNLEAMRRMSRGYAGGGFVGNMTMPALRSSKTSGDLQVIINNAPPGTNAREEKRPGPDGREMRRLVVEIVDQHISTGGADKPLGTRFGTKPKTTPR